MVAVPSRFVPSGTACTKRLVAFRSVRESEDDSRCSQLGFMGIAQNHKADYHLYRMCHLLSPDSQFGWRKILMVYHLIRETTHASIPTRKNTSVGRRINSRRQLKGKM